MRERAAQLKPAQRRAVDELESGATEELTRARYEELTGVGRSQAAYDLAELVETGVFLRSGSGRATRYRLARPERGRRRWTSDRIRAELAEFCSGHTAWPSAADFKRAGRSDLYVAASRYGGIGFWAAELGFARPARAARETEARPRASARAAALAAAAVSVALGVGAVLMLAADDSGRTPTAPAGRESEATKKSAPPVVRARPGRRATRVRPTPSITAAGAPRAVERSARAERATERVTRAAPTAARAPKRIAPPAPPPRPPRPQSGPQPLKAPPPSRAPEPLPAP